MADRIKELPLENVISDRFGRYSKYIIQERALPDVRDGLKPVQRRILYAMYQDGNTADKAFRKSAKSVGNIMGNYHPHGDSSIYEAMVRMSQDWKNRAPLIEMHGNNGSIDGDPPAAMRYTEARLSKISNHLLEGINNETVDMMLNFDDTLYEPVVLPAAFPNLLVNGATGISAGYATQIPPHNLTEVMEALIYLIKNPGATTAKLMEYVKGPDFPTGAIVQGKEGLVQAYETGRGRVMVRSKTHIDEVKGKKKIIVTEIPFDVNKAQLIKRIEELKADKRLEGIGDIRDESDRFGLSISIDLKKNVNPDDILNYLYKNTDLQVSYNFNVIAIDEGKPKLLGLKEILNAYLNHRREVILKQTKFFLDKAQKRTHIIDGLIKAVSILDDVIKTIRASENRLAAIQNLMDAYQFTQAQSEAIVNLQLYRLTNTDIVTLENELKELREKIEEYQKILSNPEYLGQVIIKGFKEIMKEFGSPRLTTIEDEITPLRVAKTVIVPDEEVHVGVTKDGYLKRSSLKSAQASVAELKEGDEFLLEKNLNTHDEIYVFTNQGNLIYRKVFEIEEARWKDLGTHLSQSAGFDPKEKILCVLALTSQDTDKRIVVATNDGYVKQISLSDLRPQSRYLNRAIRFVNFKSDQSIVTNVIEIVNEYQEILTVTKKGMALKFNLSEVPLQKGRSAGVKLISLHQEDSVCGISILRDSDNYLGIMQEDGKYKNIQLAEIPLTTRAKKGVRILRQNSSHEIIIFDFVILDADRSAMFDVQTQRGEHFSFNPVDFPKSSRQALGKPVYSVRDHGVVIKLTEIKQEDENDE
ncbi:DNA topoisomerase IV subunit A [Xylocopilactobacillus apicola]|uniref:DNA topoisomerase 4 subunit A n=1 Tax=Xylocopilactobacillus apicola TaxID=2932184 RepID=A0AAU9DC81_9LACO|nr:DNA topoisomerase IV subunit A [Xylocopilactobacillus apicola]BDR58412.1 DNA topoisomerase 4 subunit A [Xylocopilactobacillus apicola]